VSNNKIIEKNEKKPNPVIFEASKDSKFPAFVAETETDLFTVNNQYLFLGAVL